MKENNVKRKEVLKLEEFTRRIKDEWKKSRDRIRKGATTHV